MEEAHRIISAFLNGGLYGENEAKIVAKALIKYCPKADIFTIFRAKKAPML